MKQLYDIGLSGSITINVIRFSSFCTAGIIRHLYTIGLCMYYVNDISNKVLQVFDFVKTYYYD